MGTKGSGYIGSPDILTSNQNMQIIPFPPSSWSIKYNLYKFSFFNPDEPCRVKINEGEPIYIAPGMGFNSNEIDSPIWSFVVVDEGIKFYWIGAY